MCIWHHQRLLELESWPHPKLAGGVESSSILPSLSLSGSNRAKMSSKLAPPLALPVIRNT